MTILLLRGAYANQFELQNYAPIAKRLGIQVVTSQHPLTHVLLPTIPLWSPADLPTFPYKRQLLNRLIGGEHWLVGLEQLKYFNTSKYRSEKKVIVHTAETYYPYTHQAAELKKRRVISKLICTCWETLPHANEKFARLRQWKKEAYKYIDLFHVPTERAKQVLVVEGVNPKKITVIPYGVDLTRFKPAKHAKHRRPLVLTVARLEKVKGMEDLEVVARKLPQTDFLVIGKGTYIPRGANIKTRSVSYDQIHKLYQQADLFLLPSRTTSTWEEQYGMVLVEAMACGLPIVTTSSGAIPEVVGDAGLIAREGDPEALRVGLLHLLSNAEERSELSRLARARAVARYDARKVAAQLRKLYK